ncbi:MAG TPA: hypothetical protein VFI37_02370, partial [Gaiellaceae bacterium]|nr:hypothetical protein [Gaiellaceae bacterium]
MTAAALARPRPSHLRGHGEAAARALAFLVLGLPLGALYLLTLPAAAAIGPETFRRPLAIERTLLNRLLGARIPAP